jgi:hypothetical protein
MGSEYGIREAKTKILYDPLKNKNIPKILKSK